MDNDKRMGLKHIKSVFNQFRDINQDFGVEQLSSGHINKTYLIKNGEGRYVLQKINNIVFKHIDILMQHMLYVADHLELNGYPHEILRPFVTKSGDYLLENRWRLLPYIKDTQVYEKVQSTQQAYAGAQFLSEFHRYLSGIDSDNFKTTLPDFLVFGLRYEQFLESARFASEERLELAQIAYDFLQSQSSLIEEWEVVLPRFPSRIIHADPKISNFLFAQDSLTEVKAIIDWDTLMEGPILYDYGDMVRSYTNLREEDDPAPGINFSVENYIDVKEGFLYHLEETLSPEEMENMDLAAQVVIYVQAIRFLVDYLRGDEYYVVQYPHQNLSRAQNQINLLRAFQAYLRSQ